MHVPGIVDAYTCTDGSLGLALVGVLTWVVALFTCLRLTVKNPTDSTHSPWGLQQNSSYEYSWYLQYVLGRQVYPHRRQPWVSGAFIVLPVCMYLSIYLSVP